MTALGDDVFTDCFHLKEIHISDANSTYFFFEGILYIICQRTVVWCCPGTQGNLVVMDGITQIGTGAFAGCKNIQSVTLPLGLTHICGAAFLGCSGLKHVSLPAGLTHIGPLAFYNCGNLTNIVLPATLNKLGAKAFRGCPAENKIDPGHYVWKE